MAFHFAEKLLPGHEGPADDEVRFAPGLGQCLHAGADDLGPGQLHVRRGLFHEKGPLLPRLHQIILARLPEDAQRDAGQPSSRAQVQGLAGLGGDGLQQIGEMPGILDQGLQNFGPGGWADQIHAAVPLDQQAKIDAQKPGLFVVKHATQAFGGRRKLGRIGC